MKQLSNNWFLEGTLDVEYKQYILLAYLQQVREYFSNCMLYPAFSDLIQHYTNLVQFQQEQSQLKEHFPKELSGLDLKNGQLIYQQGPVEEEGLEAINQIVEYSIPQMKYRLEEGKEIYESIDEEMEISTVGVLPLYRNEGYFLLRSASHQKEVKAFQYTLTVMEHEHAWFRGIKTEFLQAFGLGMSVTYESIKLELIRRKPFLPNPATFLVYNPLMVPEQEALLPVAKRKFMRFLSSL